LIRSDPHTWPALVRAALPVIDFVLQRLETRHDLSTAQGKASAADEIAEVLAGIANPIEQDVYTNEVAARLKVARLKVDAAAVRRLLNGRSKQQREVASRPSMPSPGQAQAGEVRGDNDDDYLLALLMRVRQLPEAKPYQGPVEFMLSESRAVYQALGGAMPAELDPYVERARKRLADVELLSTPRVLEGIELKLLEIRGKKLHAQRSEVNTLLRDGVIDLEEAVRRLDKVRGELEEVARKLPPERERAGSR
jgi:DNA primase